MSSQKRLTLATLKGTIDAYVELAKMHVRVAYSFSPGGDDDYTRGYRDSRCAATTRHLRDMRDIQRTVHEFCKGEGYHV